MTLVRKAGLEEGAASGRSAMFPASVPVFKSGHDPSTPQDHPGHKERAPLGMTAEEKESEGHAPKIQGKERFLGPFGTSK